MPEAVARRPTRTSSLKGAQQGTAQASSAAREGDAYGPRSSAALLAGGGGGRGGGRGSLDLPGALVARDKENLVPASAPSVSRLSNPLYDRYADDGVLLPSGVAGSYAHRPPEKSLPGGGRRNFGPADVAQNGGWFSATLLDGQSRNQWFSTGRDPGGRAGGKRRGSNALAAGSTASPSPFASPGRFHDADEEEVFLDDDDGSGYLTAVGAEDQDYYGDSDVLEPEVHAAVEGTCVALRSGAWYRSPRNLSVNWKVLSGLTLVSVVVRLFRISQPTSVVFDEVHFGGFASKYIKGQYFMDVHPPLGKLLIALSGILAGFDGQFDFKEIGKDYLEPNVPYITMRMMPAVMGGALVPTAYLTARRSGCSTQASAFAGLAVLFENGLTTQSRHILLDSPLIFFIALALLMWVSFRRWQRWSFSFEWWFWLTMTGVALGLAVSVKWVGLFTMALVGLHTIKDLWVLLGDVRIKPGTLVQHFLARALCLAVLPTVIYMFFFELHFLTLPNSGEGNGFMSAEFQHTLRGIHLPSTVADVAYGSKVFISHVATNGGYLHSHPHNYLTGSKQQQITLYPHRDDNSYFLIKKKIGQPMNSTEPEWVMNGDVIRLEHVSTHRHLHSHDHRPPVTENENHNEVSAYGAENFAGDSNDYWRLEILESDPSDSESARRVRAIHSKFRLVHVGTNCHLFSHSIKLPDYAFGQQEVTCMKSPKRPKTLWRVVENVNDKLPKDAEVVHYHQPGFLRKFLELHKVMWNTNQGLTDSHPFDSKPATWPFLTRGISFWTKDQKQIYLLGNPFVWWMATMSVSMFAAAKLVLALRKQRGYRDRPEIRAQYESTMGLFFTGWLCHYGPFFLMRRQLFAHHYFPALYFAILASCCAFDLAIRRLRWTARLAAVVVCAALFLYAFVRFSFITYGLPTSRAACERAKWLASWDFDCAVFGANGPGTPTRVATPA